MISAKFAQSYASGILMVSFDPTDETLPTMNQILTPESLALDLDKTAFKEIAVALLAALATTLSSNAKEEYEKEKVIELWNAILDFLLDENGELPDDVHSLQAVTATDVDAFLNITNVDQNVLSLGYAM